MGERKQYIFVEVDTRRPLYQRNAETGELDPWAFDSRQDAEELLELLAEVPASKTATGRPMSAEWLDIVEIDRDNYAKYAEWNFPVAEERTG